MGFLDVIFGNSKRKAEEAKRLEEERLETERKAREEAERRAREEAERKAREQELMAQLEAERKAREEAERRAIAERMAKEEAERRAIAERKAKEEAERKAKEEAERKAKEEAERKAKEEAERKAKEEAERKAKEEAERKAKKEAERKAKEEAKHEALLKIENTLISGEKIEKDFVFNLTKPKEAQGFLNFSKCLEGYSFNMPPFFSFRLEKDVIIVSSFVHHLDCFYFNDDYIQAAIKKYGNIVGALDMMQTEPIGSSKIKAHFSFVLGEGIIPYTSNHYDTGLDKAKMVLGKIENNYVSFKFYKDILRSTKEISFEDLSVEEKSLLFQNNDTETVASGLYSKMVVASFIDEEIYNTVEAKGSLLGSINNIVGYDDKYIYYELICFLKLDESENEEEKVEKDENDLTDLWDKYENDNTSVQKYYDYHLQMSVDDELGYRVKPIKYGNMSLAIVGMQYRNNYQEIINHIDIGTKVTIKRELGNEFDDDAWAFYLGNGIHIGYVSKKEKAFAKLFLKKGYIDATICKIEGSWVDAEIFLYEDMIDETILDYIDIHFMLFYDKKKYKDAYLESLIPLSFCDFKKYLSIPSISPNKELETVEPDNCEETLLETTESIIEDDETLFADDIEIALSAISLEDIVTMKTDDLLFITRTNDNQVFAHKGSKKVAILKSDSKDLRKYTSPNKPIPCYFVDFDVRGLIVKIPSLVVGSSKYMQYIVLNCMNVFMMVPTITFETSFDISDDPEKELCIKDVNEIKKRMQNNEEGTCTVLITPKIEGKGVYYSLDFSNRAYYFEANGNFIQKYLTNTGHGAMADIIYVDDSKMLTDGIIEIHFEITCYDHYPKDVIVD